MYEEQCISGFFFYSKHYSSKEVCDFQIWITSQVVYIWSSLLQLTVESRDLSQAEKKFTKLQAEQIHKMSTIFTQKHLKNVMGEKFCHFVNLHSL